MEMPAETGMRNGAALQDMVVAAHRFFACRDRARAFARLEPSPVLTLAEAIERDFAGFDMERAEAEFRMALAALCGAEPPEPLSMDIGCTCRSRDHG
jgi:hypothetical protein